MPTHAEVSERPSSDNDQLARYQNSYRLASDNAFQAETVDKLVQAILAECLEKFSYEASESAKMCTNTAAAIQKAIQQLEYHRYKVVVAMTIVEKASQSMDASMGFLWDNQRDGYSTYTYEEFKERKQLQEQQQQQRKHK